MAPKVAQFSVTYPQAKFYQFDVDELADLAADLEIRAMPSFLFYKDGKRLDNDVIGANPPALEAGIKSLVA